MEELVTVLPPYQDRQATTVCDAVFQTTEETQCLKKDFNLTERSCSCKDCVSETNA